jgi:hypothetical protein
LFFNFKKNKKNGKEKGLYNDRNIDDYHHNIDVSFVCSSSFAKGKDFK